MIDDLIVIVHFQSTKIKGASASVRLFLIASMLNRLAKAISHYLRLSVAAKEYLINYSETTLSTTCGIYRVLSFKVFLSLDYSL
ncbi:MAG: hypothetical protein ABFC56_00160 [Clostridiaceae bacterium]